MKAYSLSLATASLGLVLTLPAFLYPAPVSAEPAIAEEVVVEEVVVVPAKAAVGGDAPETSTAEPATVISGEAAPTVLAEEATAPVTFKQNWEGNKFDKRHNKYLKYDKDGQVDASPVVIPLDYLPKDKEGFIDWAKAMKDGTIQPLPALTAKRGEQMQTVRYDLDVVLRPSKTFMPDVVFPHDAHNDWLNCGNCHDNIFKMKKKASGITMKRIWKGEFCGRCHDRVAFPLRHCFRCHAGERAAAFEAPAPVEDNYVDYYPEE